MPPNAAALPAPTCHKVLPVGCMRSVQGVETYRHPDFTPGNHTSFPGFGGELVHFTYRMPLSRGQNRQDGGFRNLAARMPLVSTRPV